MRPRHPVLLLALCALVAACPVAAEPVGSHVEITPFGGFTIFDAKLKTSSGAALRDAVYVGARIGWHVRSWWGIELAGGVTPTSEDLAGGRDVSFVHGSGNLLVTPLARRAGGPFLSVGGGAARLTPSGGTKFDQGTVEVAGGVRLWLTDAVGLRLEARDVHYLPKYGFQQSVDYMTIGAGLTVALGTTPRDTDGDGVPDKRDKCPDTPRGARVNADGCPVDSDGDKVFDGLDQCEGTPKGCTVDAKGCPTDADADGVFDGLDTCANTPKGARVDPKGCPTDADKDTVVDGIDRCDNTPVGAKVNPDGCPIDSDHDTVYDGIDLCDGTPAGARVDKNGCPIEVSEKETQLLDTGLIRIENINFDTGKTTLKGESHKVLDEVGTVLMQWPQLQIEVGGHCDSRGSEATNQRLSEGRAKAVLDYLQQKFPSLGSGQYTAKGYGESFPVSDNKTELGRAKNRRVEFKVLNTDVLKKEVEKRKMLKN